MQLVELGTEYRVRWKMTTYMSCWVVRAAR